MLYYDVECYAAAAEDVWRVLMPPPDGYEDGTQSFLSISQLQFGFEQLHKLGGVQVHTRESPGDIVSFSPSLSVSCTHSPLS